ncbi:F-BAR and double SH3 domains protein 2-like isoform X4 [Haliotis rufescens]|uniref:F-BAR and double SH3 domains protein 2-like isoform X4 n=1 Tax=Haliotis rufescens TaxID=6454 RepID=UPI001EAFD2EB|nr:F-BAR and double SH3 domains protein 2-like isoform X4 [Haliotis rufescens]
MLPPPRKVKPTVALKHIHSEQVAKLQAKHQQECDLLEDIRSFSLQRSKLEKEYAQGLLKLSSQLLKREFPSQPDIISEDGLEHNYSDGRTACTVWHQILEETEKVAKARLQAAEIFMEKIAESAKPLKVAKVHSMKKVAPQLSTIQTELGQTVLEMTKCQKAYNVDETYSHEARQKAGDAEDKLKRKSTGLFQSLASLQKQCSKLKSRYDACEVKSTASRNDYILALSAANAHQIRYYSTDMPDLTKGQDTVDGEVYEKIQEYFSLLGSTVVEISQAEANSFENVVNESAKISRAFSLQCFLFCNPVFTDLVQYQFEPCHNDQCSKASGDHNAMPDLEKEAKKWAAKVAKETKSIREYHRILKCLQTQGSDRVSDSGIESNSTTASSSTQDPEVKMEEMRQNIRKAETGKMKAEARLEALRSAGINVDEYLSNAQSESLGTDDICMARTPSQMSLRTESSGGHSADDHEPTYTHYDDDDDFIDDAFNTTTGQSTTQDPTRKYPLKCNALYEFQASNYDELTIAANEELELVADGDGEGWVKARSSSGKTGYIPENYVTFDGEGQPNGSVAQGDAPSLPVSAGSAPPPPPPPASSEPMSPTSINDNQHDTTSSYSSGDLEVQQTTEEMAVDNVQPGLGDAMWARALYDYVAQDSEEISFAEGSLIKVIRKDNDGVDDGYWEGEFNGNSGLFPSMVVEELTADQEVMSPGVDYVPPPPVTVTMPTPDAELPPPPVTNGDDSATEPISDNSTPEQNYKKVRFSNNHMVPTDVLQPHYPLHTQWEDSEEEGEESVV